MMVTYDGINLEINKILADIKTMILMSNMPPLRPNLSATYPDINDPKTPPNGKAAFIKVQIQVISAFELVSWMKSLITFKEFIFDYFKKIGFYWV